MSKIKSKQALEPAYHALQAIKINANPPTNAAIFSNIFDHQWCFDLRLHGHTVSHQLRI
jgi:hypothetical protein